MKKIVKIKMEIKKNMILKELKKLNYLKMLREVENKLTKKTGFM